MIEITPDFNDALKPHRIESRMGVFHYFLSNASPKISDEARESEEKREAKVKLKSPASLAYVVYFKHFS